MKKIIIAIVAALIAVPAFAHAISVGVQVNTTAIGDTATSSVIIETDGDLRVYTAAVQAEDENVGTVEATEDEVTVEYAQRVYLFGFIPLKSTVQAVATADGAVAIHYPWYAFLSSSSRSQVEARVQNSVDTALRDGVGEAGQFSARVRAGLVSAMRAALKTSLEADLAAEASQ